MVEQTTSLIPQYHAKEYAKEKFERRVYIGCILVIVLVTWEIHRPTVIPSHPTFKIVSDKTRKKFRFIYFLWRYFWVFGNKDIVYHMIPIYSKEEGSLIQMDTLASKSCDNVMRGSFRKSLWSTMKFLIKNIITYFTLQKIALISKQEI